MKLKKIFFFKKNSFLTNIKEVGIDKIKVPKTAIKPTDKLAINDS